MRSDSIIAATFGWDVGDVRDGRYQSTRTKRPVYVCGENYYCVSPSCPKECDLKWTKYRDQFFADKAGTVLWEAKEDE